MSHVFLSMIKAMIEQNNGCLSFADFMATALYHPQYGYYCKKDSSFGRSEDFITAPLLSPLFAACLAAPCQQVIQTIHSASILELGAGTGRLAGQLLQTLDQHQALPEYYYIYEISTTLREKQYQFLKTHFPKYLTKYVWLTQLPHTFRGIILANEVLDALPVHCFAIHNHSIQERAVTWHNNQLSWHLTKPFSKGLVETVTPLYQQYAFPEGYQSEINLQLEAFIAPLVKCLEVGTLLFIDYGYGQKEYYHPDRKQGTLSCFYQHHYHDNPLNYPGHQDITAHVDFTRVAAIAIHHLCHLVGFTTQAAFLLSCGLIALAQEQEKTLTEKERFDMHQAIKTLTFPTEMGERIKVIAFNKATDLLLYGFHLNEMSHRLS